jgi:hypothetical protein
MTAHAALMRSATLREALRRMEWSGFPPVGLLSLMGIADLVSEAVHGADHGFGDFPAQVMNVGIDHAGLL